MTIFICAIFVFCYTAFFVSLRRAQLFWAFLVCIITFCATQFIIMPFISKMYTKKVEIMLERFNNNMLETVEERTELFMSLTHYPTLTSVVTFIYASLTTLFLCMAYHFIPAIGLDIISARISYIACLFGSYITALIIFHFCERITKKHIEAVLKTGISQQLLKRKTFFGTKKTYYGISVLTRCIMFLFIPVVFSNILSYYILKQGYMVFNGIVLGPIDQIIRIIVANVLQIILSGSLILLFKHHMERNNNQLREVSMELLETGNPNTELKTTLSDQIQYNVYLLGSVISHYKALMDKFSDIGKDVLHSTEDLSIISGKISTSSVEQSADVKEILSTMEDSNALSKNVASRISEVSEGTDKTKDEVSEAFNLLKENIQCLDDINDSNQGVIDGIKDLSTQVDNIDDIVTIIKDIADQTKIIAFNAELEAVSNGKNGRNFHIVATEIRRLANNTMESIEKIQSYIENIKSASRDLIFSSEQSTDFIHEEASISKQLETQFGGIMESSNDTNEKATEISGIIEQQTASFNQIVITLRQISSGIESFAQSTKTITNTVNEMKNIAFKLSNMKDNI
ncbi:MAG: methyl-accepting chemotaxis protein [Treponema sp.]|nr:methyl-accepting chemotaxis protein [Candidatus Treponema equi]